MGKILDISTETVISMLENCGMGRGNEPLISSDGG